MFKKILPSKDSEKKQKEEEDPNAEINLTFEVSPVKSNESLNYLLKELKIGGVFIDSFETFNKSLNKLFAQYKNNTREIDFRYSKICEKEEEMADLSKI
jgi:hypothetical protein